MLIRLMIVFAVCLFTKYAGANEKNTKNLPVAKLKKGGQNLSAFSIDYTTKHENVLRKMEELIKKYFKHKYSWEDYIALLDELKNTDRYIVCPGRDFIKTFDKNKVVIYFRHDLDWDVNNALRMAKAENARGLRGSYYLLPTSPYYGKQTKTGVIRYADMDKHYRKIQNLGHEIGVHNDLLAMMIIWDIDPIEFQKQELAYYHANGFPVVGAVSNGSKITLRRKLNNKWIFSEFRKKGVYNNNGVAVEYGKHSFKDFGFIYAGYIIGHNTSTSDIHGFKTGMGVVEQIRKFKPGSRVSLLIHPIHWGEQKKKK